MGRLQYQEWWVSRGDKLLCSSQLTDEVGPSALCCPETSSEAAHGALSSACSTWPEPDTYIESVEGGSSFQRAADADSFNFLCGI